VAEVGKEATTHRLTRAEKEAVTEIIYRYRQKGWRTSENEIVRIGINWLLADHAKREQGSVLHRVLEALQGRDA
jgi:3-methyladenine DNA glycosylase AlkD